ncbi:MAG: two pore domain potassium channel family protein [Acidothermus sp.]|nr:two pore domain potassium channel family protein [Acidothermus sp.]
MSDDRQQAYERFTQIADPLMMALAVIMIPLLVIPQVVALPAGVRSAISAADWTIWALFAVEYLVKLTLAPSRSVFVRTHVIDLAILVLPFLRPLRVLRLLRLGSLLVRVLRDSRAILGRRGLRYVALVSAVVLGAGAAAEVAVERSASGGNIRTFGDALWWAFTTVTTVGYGDRYPVTATGRAIAIVLMLTGMALFGTLTAGIAAYFVESNQPSTSSELAQRLEGIENELRSLREMLRDRAEANGNQPRRDGSASSLSSPLGSSPRTPWAGNS